MCGRFSIAKEAEDIVARFETKLANAFSKNFNAAPTQSLPVVTNKEPEVINFYRWGLIPFWAKDPSIGNRMINARAETINEKSSFKNIFKNKRCLVISDGFYEWKRIEAKKQPYRIVLKSEELFSYAGLWDSWNDGEGNYLNTFIIITTEANEMMKELHDRMPVILYKEDEMKWLNNDSDSSFLTDLLKPYPSDFMKMYPVSNMVNSIHNNSSDLIVPLNKY